VFIHSQRAGGVQAELDRKEEGQLQRVVTLLSRPVRIVRGQAVSAAVDESLFEAEEERALHAAAQAAASHIRSDMSIPEFLQVGQPLLFPLLPIKWRSELEWVYLAVQS